MSEANCEMCGYPEECHVEGWHADDCALALSGSAGCDCCVAYVCKNFVEAKTITEMGLFGTSEVKCDETNNSAENIARGEVVIDVKFKVRF